MQGSVSVVIELTFGTVRVVNTDRPELPGR